MLNKNKKLEPILKRLVNEAQTRETRSLTSPDPKPIGPVMKRVLADLEAYSDPKEIVYQHTVLCQTVMPYRNPGDAVRLWQRSQGRAHLEIQAGRAFDPTVEDFVDVGLPFGPKPRLMLYHLNAQAVKTRSPEIEVEDSLTAFVKRLGLAAHGRNIRMIKDQLSRLSASDFRIGTMCDGRAITIKASIVTGFRAVGAQGFESARAMAQLRPIQPRILREPDAPRCTAERGRHRKSLPHGDGIGYLHLARAAATSNP